MQSQTQGGRRYTPHLTRFYAAAPPAQLRECIVAALGALGVKHKDAPPAEAAAYADDASAEAAGDAGDAGTGALRLRVGGLDARRETFKGWIEIEPYVHRRGGDGAQGAQGSFCVLRREVVRRACLSWKRQGQR
jgi:serine/threonine-protein kinase Chk1